MKPKIVESDAHTDEERKKFHAMIRDISKQVKWADDFMDEEDWKRVILAGLYGQKVVPNPFGDGFVVVNNKRSSDLKKIPYAEMIEQVQFLGESRGVKWSKEDV